MTLLAGADARIITPALDPPVYLAGFSSNRPATSVNDDLYVRTVAFGTAGDDPVVITAVDCIGLVREHQPKGRHVVAATHTHHGPDTIGLWGPQLEVTGRDDAYVASIRASIADSKVAAIERMVPATAASAATAEPTLVANFRDPSIVDSELSVLRLSDLHGDAIATLMSYPCHPEVVDPDNTAISADYAGYLCKFVEADAGGLAIFVAGGLGGMLSPATEEHTHTEAERFGRVLADDVHSVLSEVRSADVNVDFGRREIRVPIANPKYEMAEQLGLVRPAQREGDLLVTEVTLTRIGSMALAGVPGELLPKLGLALKYLLRTNGFSVPAIVGLADDELGYILAEEDFVYPADYFDPGKQYEESMSVGHQIGPAVMAGLDTLISEAVA